MKKINNEANILPTYPICKTQLREDGMMIVISKVMTTSKLGGVPLQEFLILRNSFLADIKINVNNTFVMDSKRKNPAIPVHILCARRCNSCPNTRFYNVKFDDKNHPLKGRTE